MEQPHASHDIRWRSGMLGDARDLPAVDRANPAVGGSGHNDAMTCLGREHASSLRLDDALERRSGGPGIQRLLRAVIAAARGNGGDHFEQTRRQKQALFAKIDRGVGCSLQYREDVERFEARPDAAADGAARLGDHDVHVQIDRRGDRSKQRRQALGRVVFTDLGARPDRNVDQDVGGAGGLLLGENRGDHLRLRVDLHGALDRDQDVVRGSEIERAAPREARAGVVDDPVQGGGLERHFEIGVAMGVTGTDVAKEASGIILLDDNFATIVDAVREGRRIFDNLRRFIRYAVTTNSAEVWLILLAPFFGLPLPLVPIQILWINLVSDGFSGLALAAEPEEKDVMTRPPRPPQESILARGLGIPVVWVSILMGGLCIGIEAWAMWTGTPAWQTMVFTGLAFCQLAHILAIRSQRESLFSQGFWSNRPLAATVIVTLCLQLGAVYLPVMNDLLKTEPLGLADLGVTVGAACVVFLAVEAEKMVARGQDSPHRSMRRLPPREGLGGLGL
ncbi:MAG: cation transporting ATPase C-terminal domain-containing protein [Candidatus Binatia bacterium]